MREYINEHFASASHECASASHEAFPQGSLTASTMKCTIQKTVVKVNINCQICKTDSLKAVTKLTGIDMVAVDGEKGTLTVVGVVDPVFIVKRLRKIGKNAEILSVGPEPPPKPPSQPTTSGSAPFDLPPCCNQCQLVAVGYGLFDDGQVCNIL